MEMLFNGDYVETSEIAHWQLCALCRQAQAQGASVDWENLNRDSKYIVFQNGQIMSADVIVGDCWKAIPIESIF